MRCSGWEGVLQLRNFSSSFSFFFSEGVLIKTMFRYLTPPTTSTAVERLFSAAGLILDARRSKLDPAWVDHILFLREAFLLGTCKLDWQ